MKASSATSRRASTRRWGTGTQTQAAATCTSWNCPGDPQRIAHRLSGDTSAAVAPLRLRALRSFHLRLEPRADRALRADDLLQITDPPRAPVAQRAQGQQPLVLLGLEAAMRECQPDRLRRQLGLLADVVLPVARV